ncbi:hypothetical protein RYX36_035661 [Vicia faba]
MGRLPYVVSELNLTVAGFTAVADLRSDDAESDDAVVLEVTDDDGFAVGCSGGCNVEDELSGRSVPVVIPVRQLASASDDWAELGVVVPLATVLAVEALSSFLSLFVVLSF